jgi:hypothetical protein
MEVVFIDLMKIMDKSLKVNKLDSDIRAHDHMVHVIYFSSILFANMCKLWVHARFLFIMNFLIVNYMPDFWFMNFHAVNYKPDFCDEFLFCKLQTWFFKMNFDVIHVKMALKTIQLNSRRVILQPFTFCYLRHHRNMEEKYPFRCPQYLCSCNIDTSREKKHVQALIWTYFISNN